MYRFFGVMILVWAGVLPARAYGQPSAACTVSSPGCFAAIDGHFLDAGRAYDALHRPAPPDYARAALEMGGLLGFGAVWYWVDREHNLADWDDPSLRQRLSLEAVRFDNNTFPINFIGHPFDGLGFHLFARGNDLSLLEATGFALATSLGWEYLLEFREKVSINDLIVSPVAGLVLGEFVHKLAWYLNSTADRGWTGRRVLASTLGISVAHDNWLDDEPDAPPISGRDSLGFTADIAHAFRAVYGLSVLRSDAGDSVVHGPGVSGRLVAIPGYRRAGTFHLCFADADVTSFSGSAAFGGRDDRVWAVSADTLVLGCHWQRSHPGSTVRDAAATVGLAVGFQYDKQSSLAWSDRVGVVHLPGLGVDLFGSRASVRAELQLRAHPDFGGIDSDAFPSWWAEHEGVRPKTVILNHGYYYAWGASTSAELTLSAAGVLEVGVRVEAGSYASQQGLDRAQEQVTADEAASDDVLAASLHARLSLTPTLFVGLGGAGRRRVSRMGGFRRARAVEVATLAIGAEF